MDGGCLAVLQLIQVPVFARKCTSRDWIPSTRHLAGMSMSDNIVIPTSIVIILELYV